ncbi:MAG: FAD-dependent oxidoreductase, partial [Bacteroidales bacterium]|nr:FAD-dependent oxidoreductase [Bacteroidales bacterium]
SVYGVEMNPDGSIAAVKAWNINAYPRYLIKGKLFADCTGDGILRLSGAKFRRGREFPSEFGETSEKGGDAKTMGNSILLQLRKTDEDHPFRAPAWAYHFTDEDFNYDTPQATIPGMKFVYKRLYPEDNNFWWIEFGGNLDTIADANDIQFELKRIAYGVWEYMKNHPDGRCKGYELDWIGSLPGKRESTRFIGPHILTQNDVASGGHFEDVVAYGGWALDDHDPDAFHKKGRISMEHPTPRIFGIPFDCLYSVNVPNLMFAGRDISCTHMGLSATRVMSTCALLGQAVGTGAAMAIRYNETPAQIRARRIAELQDCLEDDDCMLPYRWRKVSELTKSAKGVPANLLNGIDRKREDGDNGVWVAPGDETAILYQWKKPVSISGARMIFDSGLKVRYKRMRKLEATTERVAMPPMMARGFRLDLRVGGKWQTVYEDTENFLRLRKVSFAPVKADAARLVVTSTWGDEKAHVFAFDIK